MTPNKPEGSQLTPDEALEDVQRFNKAAEATGFPKMNEYSDIDEVKAAEELLQESGGYTPKEHKFLTLTEIKEAMGGIESTSPKFDAMRNDLLTIAERYVQQLEIEPEAKEIIEQIKSVTYGSNRNLFMQISNQHGEFMRRLKLQAGGQRSVPLRPAVRWGEPKPHDHGWISTPSVSFRKSDPDNDRAAATLALLNGLIELTEAKWGFQLFKAFEELRVTAFYHGEVQKENMKKQVDNATTPDDKQRLISQQMALSGYNSVENLQREIDGLLGR